jgi:hypothetical protein
VSRARRRRKKRGLTGHMRMMGLRKGALQHLLLQRQSARQQLQHAIERPGVTMMMLRRRRRRRRRRVHIHLTTMPPVHLGLATL